MTTHRTASQYQSSNDNLSFFCGEDVHYACKGKRSHNVPTGFGGSPRFADCECGCHVSKELIRARLELALAEIDEVEDEDEDSTAGFLHHSFWEK